MIGRVAISGLFAGAILFARSAAADEPVAREVHDPGAYPPPAVRTNMLIAGAATTVVWYGAAVGFSYWFPDAPGADDLRIPVAGPWMALADTGCADDDPGCSTFIVVLRAILTTIDGVGQAGGLAIMAEALFVPTQERRPRSALLPMRKLEHAPSFELRPVPFVAARDGLGLGVVGRF